MQLVKLLGTIEKETAQNVLNTLQEMFSSRTIPTMLESFPSTSLFLNLITPYVLTRGVYGRIDNVESAASAKYGKSGSTVMKVPFPLLMQR